MPPIEWPQVTALLTAMTALLGVVLVQARQARAEARHRDAETQKILSEIEASTKRTDGQISNSHSTNLRDDLDRMHRDIGGLSQRVGELGRQQAQILAEQTRQAGQLADLAADMRDVRQLTIQTRQNAHDTHTDIFRRLRDVETHTLTCRIEKDVTT